MSKKIKVFIPLREELKLSKFLVGWINDVELTDRPREADLFVFAGGADVSPFLYGENKHKTTACDPVRDLKEIYYYRLGKGLDKKMIGICRGAQFLTVMAGGKLLQNVGGHTRRHNCYFPDGTVIEVVSTHHQMMNPFNLPRDSYKIIGAAIDETYCYDRRAQIYQDGDGETVKMAENTPEPEFVYYAKEDTLAIQGHPERQTGHRDRHYINHQKFILNNYLESKMDNYANFEKI